MLNTPYFYQSIRQNFESIGKLLLVFTIVVLIHVVVIRTLHGEFAAHPVHTSHAQIIESFIYSESTSAPLSKSVISNQDTADFNNQDIADFNEPTPDISIEKKIHPKNEREIKKVVQPKKNQTNNSKDEYSAELRKNDQKENRHNSDTSEKSGVYSTGAETTLPSADASYLNNPHPVYPRVSKRLGEQGKVVLSVLINVDGTASRVQLKSSSGFQRLDDVAIETVKKWRYVPGKVAGTFQPMWFNIPINFVLE